MKKQYFILLAIAGMSAIMNVKAQNTPIDDFLKKYPSREGVTHVSLSQQMLQSIFAPPKDPTDNSHEASMYKHRIRFYGELNVPEAYSSVTISKKDISENVFADLKKTLLSSKYEQFMEVNKENNSILGYYLKKLNEKTNEIVVLRHQKDQFSTIYIKGDIDINYVNTYLDVIRGALSRFNAYNQIDMFLPSNQFAFSMPSFDDLKFPNFQGLDFKDFKFDSETFKQRMEESKQRMEESMKKWNDKMQTEFFQQNIQDAIEKAKKQMEEAQQQMEEIKLAEEE